MWFNINGLLNKLNVFLKNNEVLNEMDFGDGTNRNILSSY